MRVIVAALALAWSLIAAPALAQTQAPITVPLIKLHFPGYSPVNHSIYVRLLELGEKKIGVPLLFDTGAVGLTVDCDVVLEPALCSTEGIRIDQALVRDGLTITQRRIVAVYSDFEEHGNLAYARVAFGDAARHVKTREMPLMIRYKRVVRRTGEVVSGPLWPKGIFGVSPVDLQAGGALVSPLDRVDLPSGLDHGFYLTPFGASWPICSDKAWNCAAVDALHLGIDDATRRDFTMLPLAPGGPDYYGHFIDACLAWLDYVSCGPTMYDTGNPIIEIIGPPRGGSDTSLPLGSNVGVVGPDIPSWHFKTVFVSEAMFSDPPAFNVVGIRYFETNSLLFDIEKRRIGFRIGR